MRGMGRLLPWEKLRRRERESFRVVILDRISEG